MTPRLVSPSILAVVVLVLASCGTVAHEEAASARSDARARGSALGSDVVANATAESGADPDSTATVGAQGAVGAGGREELASSATPPPASPEAAEQASAIQGDVDEIGPCGPPSDVVMVGHQSVEPLLRRSVELYLTVCPESGRFVVDPGDSAEVGFAQACDGTLDLVAYPELPSPADHSVCGESGRRLVSFALAATDRPEAEGAPELLHLTVVLAAPDGDGADLASREQAAREQSVDGVGTSTDVDPFVDYLIGMGYRQVFAEVDLPDGVVGLDTEQLEASRVAWRGR